MSARSQAESSRRLFPEAGRALVAGPLFFCLLSVRFLKHISGLVWRQRPQASAVKSKWCGLAELVEGRSRTSKAAQTLALSTAAGISSWDEIARAAIDYGDENFAGEVVGFVEQQLRQMS